MYEPCDVSDKKKIPKLAKFTNHSSPSPLKISSRFKASQPNTTECLPFSVGERALWRAVITQALTDAANNSSKTVDKIERARARVWFSLGNPDFITVCSYADLDPYYVFERAKKAIEQGCKWRKSSDNRKKKPKVRKSSSPSKEYQTKENLIKEEVAL